MKELTTGIIYYTDFHVDENIQSICLSQLKKCITNQEVVSVSLNREFDFGRNIVMYGHRSTTMYVRQILTALENLTTDVVFFCEHDVIYDPSHFNFIPESRDIFYYNLNNSRWDYPNDRLVSYEGLTSLSMMCCFRELALSNYRGRFNLITNLRLDKEDGSDSTQARWARKMGYEPGTKKRRIGGFSDDLSETWKSASPSVDIRHKDVFSNLKVKLSHFKHKPEEWKEGPISLISNFDLNQMFKI